MNNNTQDTTNNKQPKKSHKLFWIIGIGIIIVLFISIAAGTSKSDKKDEKPASEPVSTASEVKQDSGSASNQDSAGAPDNAAPADTSDNAATAGTSSGKIGDYNVSILDAKKVTDYQGNPAIIVNFDYTNNSSESRMFSTSVACTAYQNGVQLSSAFILDGSYDAEESLKNIKPGSSLKVQQAYVLDDAAAPVTVEVTGWLSFDGKKLTKEFTF